MGVALLKRIDVLLAACEGGTYLPAQLSSLLAQDDPCFAVIARDDCSRDATPRILLDAAGRDARVTLLPSDRQRLGAAANFFTLMRASRAPYSALCDQDDEWLPCRLSACRDAMEQAERRYGEATPLLVHSDCVVTDAQGRTLHPSLFRHQGWDPRAVTLPRLLVQNNVTGCTVLMNAALRTLACAHAQVEAPFMHDWYLALCAAGCGHIVFVKEALVRYRQHGRNVMGASPDTLPVRALRMIASAQAGRERIALTYRNAAMLRSSLGSALPADALRVVDEYIATQSLPKMRRVARILRGGYLMQSPVTLAGQLLLG